MRIARYLVDRNASNGHGPNAPNIDGLPPGPDSEIADEPSV
jgi:hypothetical protein